MLSSHDCGRFAGTTCLICCLFQQSCYRCRRSAVQSINNSLRWSQKGISVKPVSQFEVNCKCLHTNEHKHRFLWSCHTPFIVSNGLAKSCAVCVKARNVTGIVLLSTGNGAIIWLAPLNFFSLHLVHELIHWRTAAHPGIIQNFSDRLDR